MDTQEVRENILNSLLELAEHLGDFEQTNVRTLGDRTIHSVAGALARCYEVPSPSSISVLCQMIQQLEE